MVAGSKSQQSQHVRLPANEPKRGQSFPRKHAYSGVSRQGYPSPPVIPGRRRLLAHFCADAELETDCTTTTSEKRHQKHLPRLSPSIPIIRGMNTVRLGCRHISQQKTDSDMGWNWTTTCQTVTTFTSDCKL